MSTICFAFRSIPNDQSQDDLLDILDEALVGAVGTLVAASLGQLQQALLGEGVAAGQDDGGVGVGGLLLADGTDEDGVVGHAAGEGGLEGELVGGGPLGALGAGLAGELDEPGQREGAGGGGHVQRRLGRQAQERAELAREGRGHLLEGDRDVEDGVVGRVLQVLGVDHSGAQLLDFAQVAVLEAAEVLLGVVHSAGEAVLRRVGEPVHFWSFEQPYVLQLAELELQVGSSHL